VYVAPHTLPLHSIQLTQSDTNGESLKVSGKNTVEELHEYCIDWKEDTLTWSIDGKDMRTLERESTWNKTSGRFDYPQTPARIMLSLWPAGLSTNAKGTVDWAGGEIDWDSPYMQNGYYFARFQEVTVECYDPPKGTQKKGKKTYKYTDEAGTNDTVIMTDDEVILGSLMGTGENPGEKPKKGDDKKPKQSDIAMVPGGNPGGGSGNQVSESGSGGQPASPGETATTDSGTGGNGVFIQDSSISSTGAGSTVQPGLSRTAGSALAIVVAVMGLIAL
jgi:hypothetical protein